MEPKAHMKELPVREGEGRTHGLVVKCTHMLSQAVWQVTGNLEIF